MSDDDMTSWMEKLAKFFTDRGNDSWSNFEALAIAKPNEGSRYSSYEDAETVFTTDSTVAQGLLAQLRFDDGYGGTEGQPFTLWTKSWVYFPVCYDGAEWAGRVRRHPEELVTNHQGGG